MPDTGAPWNIPYVAASDLVKDWPTDNQTQAEAIADALTDAAIALGKNVVQAVKTDTFSTSSTSLVDVTDLEVTITPSSATSKVLLIAQVTLSGSVSAGAVVAFAGGNSAGYIGDAAGTRLQGWGHGRGEAGIPFQVTGVYLDSPATTSAVTYKVQMRAQGSTQYINRTATDTNGTSFGRTASSLTAIEVAA